MACVSHKPQRLAECPSCKVELLLGPGWGVVWGLGSGAEESHPRTAHSAPSIASLAVLLCPTS